MTRRHLVGASLILLGLMLAVSLASYTETDWPQSSIPQVQNLCGRFGAYVSYWLVLFFGRTAWFGPLAAIWIGVLQIRGVDDAKSATPHWRQPAVSMALLFCFLSGTLHQIWPERGGPGGTMGAWLNDRLQYVFGGVGTAFILFFAGMIGAAGLLPQKYLKRAADHMKAWPQRLWTQVKDMVAARRGQRPPIPIRPVTQVEAVESSPVIAESATAAPVQTPFVMKTIPFPGPAAKPPTVSKLPAPEPVPDFETPEEREFQKSLAKYRTPPLELLKWPPDTDIGQDQKVLQNAGQILENTLKNFGIDAQVTQIVPGPTVTLYEVLPAAGVAVNRIAAREADLKLALAANALRIVAPIPGKSVVGVEVPNPKPALVKIRELLAFEKFTPGSFTLPFALGKDILGKSVIVDLQKMPHVLIAGATGSGKSICVANLLITLLYRMTPAQLRLILIDPKRVELSVFGEIPHLLAPPILDAKDALRAFKWLTTEMESRLNTLSDSGAKKIESYNLEQERLGLAPMPYIVLVVDELADLMLADHRSVEDAITRLAQLSRAVGIHLVLATQRPSVDVITGLIKANMPARIGFKVSSQFDSQTILAGGARRHAVSIASRSQPHPPAGRVRGRGGNPPRGRFHPRPDETALRRS